MTDKLPTQELEYLGRITKSESEVEFLNGYVDALKREIDCWHNDWEAKNRQLARLHMELLETKELQDLTFQKYITEKQQSQDLQRKLDGQNEYIAELEAELAAYRKLSAS